MIMGLPMMFLTFCNFSTRKELIRLAPHPQGHWTSSREKFFDKSPISATVRLMNELIIEPSAPLNSQDSPHQTYGCRCQNPNNCMNNSMENICAFVRADNICKKPPKNWARQYENLLMLADITNHIK
jgi:hypothetical protein